MTSRLASVAIVCSAALLVAALPAQGVNRTGKATPPSSKAQIVVENPLLPLGINGRGRTRITDGRMRTNAGQRATVRVKVRTVQGKKIPRKQFTVVRHKDGSVWTRARLKRKAKVLVTIDAPATGGFSGLHKVRRYVAKPYKGFQQGLPMGGNSNEWTALFSWLSESVGGAIVGEAVGWSISMLFNAGKDDPLKPVLDQLNQLERQLDGIKNQMDDLSKNLNEAACDIQTNGTARSVAAIRSFNKDLQRMIKSRNTNGEDLKNWVDNAIKSDTLETELDTLDTILRGQAGTNGSIVACSRHYYDQWDQPLDEVGYYNKVWRYVSYFQQVQLLGLSSLVEAYHYMAVRRAKESGRKLPDVKTTSKICVPGAAARFGDAVKDYCNRAFQATDDLYFNIVRQSLMAGAAWGWNPNSVEMNRKGDKGPTIAAQKGTNYVWALELNRFGWIQENCGDTVIDSADKQCARAMFRSPFDVPNDLKFTWLMHWDIAGTAPWARILATANHDGVRISEIMESAGFAKGKQDKLIVYTGENEASDKFSTWMRWPYWPSDSSWRPLAKDYAGWCLFDSHFIARKSQGVWPICAGADGVKFYALMNDYTDLGENVGYRIDPSQLVKEEGSNPKFYDGTLGGPWTNYGWAQADIVKAPGWMSTTPGYLSRPSQAAYMWPYFDASKWNDNCGSLQFKAPHNNAAEWVIPSRIALGKDAQPLSLCSGYRAWFKSWMPPQPQGPDWS